jgi:hypothetical protein
MEKGGYDYGWVMQNIGRLPTNEDRVIAVRLLKMLTSQ